jgi:predicted MFS family arabinose efflux permease
VTRSAVANGSEGLDVNRPVTILAVILLGCVGASMFQVEPMFLGAAAMAMGLDGAQLGWLAGVELIGAVLGSVVAVLWVSLINWRMVGFASLGVVVVGNLVSGVVDQLSHLMIIRFVTGFLGQGTIYAVALVVISEMRNPNRVFGLLVASQVGLTMIAMLLLPGLVENWGTRGVLVPLAAFALFAMLFVAKIPTRTTSLSDPTSEKNTETLFPVFVALGAQIVWYLGVGAIWAFIERIGSASQIELQGIGTALAIGTGISIAGALLASIMSGGPSRLKMYAFAMLVQVIALYMLAGPMTWMSFAIAITLFNLSWNFALPFLLGAIAAQDSTGRLTVLIVAAQGIGVALGPVIGGYLSLKLGLGAVSYFCILACIASLGIFAWMVRLTRVNELSLPQRGE